MQIQREASAPPFGASPARRRSRPDIAIGNATLITITGGDIENGTRRQRKDAVGRNVNIPAGVRTIDGTASS
jgi:hypothetical protein